MVAMLMRMGRPASDVIGVLTRQEAEWQADLARARRRGNDPCPCGSRLKFVQCHGWKNADRDRKHRGARTRRSGPRARAVARS
jgi:hypothetical protein